VNRRQCGHVTCHASFAGLDGRYACAEGAWGLRRHPTGIVADGACVVWTFASASVG
jgi:hypothetical protein